MIVGISKQIIKIMMRGESLSDTDSAWPRLEQLVPVYGGSQWSSDWIPGVKFPKQIIIIMLLFFISFFLPEIHGAGVVHSSHERS